MKIRRMAGGGSTPALIRLLASAAAVQSRDNPAHLLDPTLSRLQSRLRGLCSSLQAHAIRKQFHKQLAALWAKHPTLAHLQSQAKATGQGLPILRHDGFNWLPLVRTSADLICKLEILMLREGQPGKVLYDIDNRLKTIFDALKKPENPEELGSKSSKGQQKPDKDEDPFYVLVEKDNLITHVAVTSDTLLEPVPHWSASASTNVVENRV